MDNYGSRSKDGNIFWLFMDLIPDMKSPLAFHHFLNSFFFIALPVLSYNIVQLPVHNVGHKFQT
jgi:hypothetical protein